MPGPIQGLQEMYRGQPLPSQGKPPSFGLNKATGVELGPGGEMANIMSDDPEAMKLGMMPLTPFGAGGGWLSALKNAIRPTPVGSAGTASDVARGASGAVRGLGSVNPNAVPKYGSIIPKQASAAELADYNLGRPTAEVTAPIDPEAAVLKRIQDRLASRGLPPPRPSGGTGHGSTVTILD